MIEEYTRTSRITKNGSSVTVETLSGVEEFTLPKVGKLECFYTDGLRTLLSTIKDVQNMEEKTIRYPGHADLFKTIITCGFLSNQQVRSGKRMVSVKDTNTELLRMLLSQGDEKDISILDIEIKKGKKKRRFRCIDYYDEGSNTTSMARMTAYTGSIIAQHIKEYDGYGVIPPEYLGMNASMCNAILNAIKKKKIKIRKK